MIVNKILTICIIVILIISAIFIGGPLKNNIEIINAIISIIAILYVIWKTKKENKKIITNKIDIFVIIFMFSSCIPLIFGTYISLESTVLSIYQTISVTAIYFLVKQLKLDTNNEYNFIEFGIILSSLVVFIIGIDNLTSNVFIKKLHDIGIPYYINTEDRMIANLGYANSTAIILAISTFISIGLSLNKEKALPKIFFGVVVFCYIVGIGLTKSKATILCFAVFFILYLIYMKGRNKKQEAILDLIATGIGAIVYIVLFEKLRTIEDYKILWLLIPIQGIINGLLWIVIAEVNKYLERVKIKYILAASSVLIVSGIVLLILGFKQTKPLVIFISEKESNEAIYYIYDVEEKQKYRLEFDIFSRTHKSNNYKIQIEEENMYDQRIEAHLEKFDNFEDRKIFEFTTNEDTKRLKIKFIRTNAEKNVGLKVNSLTINGEEIILKYKYFPTSLVNLLRQINIKNKGAWERGVFILDGIKIAKDNFLFGAGGNAWNYLHGEVQSYSYVAPQSHCFYTQVIIENGIFRTYKYFRNYNLYSNICN